MASDEQIAARIRATRAFGNLSPKEAAEIMGISVRQLQRYEDADWKRQGPADAQLAALAGRCKVPIQFIHAGWEALDSDETRVFERRLRVIEDALEDLKSRTVSPETLSDAVERALDGLAQASFPGQQRDVRRPAGTDRPRGA